MNDSYIQLKRYNDSDKLLTYWCEACQKWMNMANKLKPHASSESHKENVRKRQELASGKTTSIALMSQATIMECVRRAETKPTRAASANGFQGARLKPEQLTERAKIVHAMLKNGIPLQRLDDEDLRDVLRGTDLPSTATSFRLYVPSVREMLFNFDVQVFNAKKESKFVTLYFDGTTDVAECLAVTMFYFDPTNSVLHRRLLKLQYVDQPLTGNELARFINTLLQKYGLAESVIAMGHDRCAVNTRAMQSLFVMYKCADLQCFSHGIANAGDEMKLELRDEFANGLNALFSKSVGHAKKAWSDATHGKAWRGKSMVRWFSMHEMCKRIVACWADIPAFLNALLANDKCKASVFKLQDMLRTSTVNLAVQFAVGVDVGDVLVKYCYWLEGEYIMSHRVFGILRQMKKDVVELMNGTRLVQLRAISDVYARYAGERRTSAELFNYGKELALPKVINMLEKLFFGSIADVADVGRDILPAEGRAYESDIWLFAALQFVDPRIAKDETIADQNIKESLAHVAWLDESEREALGSELGSWRTTAAAEVQKANPSVAVPPLPTDALGEDSFNIARFWQQFSRTLPHWHKFAMQALLVFPSSASVERVFAALERLFHATQSSTLEDVREVAVKAHYDKNFNK